MSAKNKIMIASLLKEVLNGKKILFINHKRSFSLQYSDKEGLAMEEFDREKPNLTDAETMFGGVWADECTSMTKEQFDRFMKGFKK